ncbi:hypothetical protein [Streptomyces sp. NBC_01477]|uniref:hypothetical protein n=1 Tax=Streptomyces sp. NBC_01477 TaxID=2976015 RepID=UPI002E3307DA|nr:hypothetical protein [Streptomyces sp. NBC_01477]
MPLTATLVQCTIAICTPDGIRKVLTAAGEPGEAARRLIALANDSGGPDNVSCVVADVVERRQ